MSAASAVLIGVKMLSKAEILVGNIRLKQDLVEKMVPGALEHVEKRACPPSPAPKRYAILSIPTSVELRHPQGACQRRVGDAVGRLGWA